jgi:hypothetical protein
MLSAFYQILKRGRVMFTANFDKTEIINVQHIIKAYIEPPKFDHESYRVIALLTYGTSVLHIGDKDECVDYLGNLYHIY